MSYYYLAASLPMLVFERAPGITIERFMLLCREHLSAEDMAAMTCLLEGQPEASPSAFSRSWVRKTAAMRDAIARERARRLGRKIESRLEGRAYDAGLSRAVEDAAARKNPLEVERALDRARWTVIEELQGLDPFSPSAVLGYGLKLAIAERWTGMSVGKGRSRLSALVSVAGGEQQASS